MAHLLVPIAADQAQPSILQFMAPSGENKPPPFVSKEGAGQYNLSAPWLIDVFLESTQEARE